MLAAAALHSIECTPQQVVTAATTPAILTDVRGAPNKLLSTRFVQ